MGALRVRRDRGPRKFRLHKPQWIDPFPWIPGTRPEKRIFEALYRRRIYFIFQGGLPEEEMRFQGITLWVPNFKPDFVIPEWKVIIDPFSDFHHALPEAIERDATKAWYYEGLGYEFLHPWSSEVERWGGLWVLDQSDRLGRPPLRALSKVDAAHKRARGFRLGEYLGLGSTSVAAANRRRRRPKSPELRVRQGRGRRRRRGRPSRRRG